MGQYWELYNISFKQVMSGSGGSKLGEMLLSAGWHAMVKYLAKPTGYKKEVTWRKSNIAKSEHKKQLGALARIPDEMIVMIFKEMLIAPRDSDELWPFFTLAITNTYLGEIAYEVVQRHFAEHWAGHRLICVGDYAKTDDLPPGVFHQDEVDAMASHKYLDGYLNSKCIHDHSRSNICGYDLYTAPKALQVELEHILCSHPDPTLRQQARCLRDLSTPRLLYDAPYQDWVVANIVSKEFVRFETIVDLQECDAVVGKGPFIGGRYNFFGLGHVILSRICWSADPSVAMHVDGLSYELHRGPWAGHRFTITTKDRLGKGVEWKDISDQVKEDMEVLADAYFGGDWRNSVKASRAYGW
ncbi:hypothetical protein K474DRAFT_176681 [Panus rudis PR-1116 ss-1]|nr:hypothetical protein K474DRAFT_176681 [Panus rudis PR-1116 ss-1]